MAKTLSAIKNIHFHGTKNGVITVGHITEPYGPKSEPVVSIAVDLDGIKKHPEWKVHIPYENIDDVIEALTTAKEEFGKDYIPNDDAIPLPFDESIGGD
ncbi:MAG: hypothetical protein L3J47_08330 [Sulfurovum sp.]|nr:hypothetical protein [Sulfurovum sp.]